MNSVFLIYPIQQKCNLPRLRLIPETTLCFQSTYAFDFFFFFFDPPQRPAQLNFFQIFFSQKNGSLYVSDDFESIWAKNIFRFFEIFLGPDTLDFDSFWRPHRAFNRYILLVLEYLPIDEQLRQRIWSLHYWFGCSDSPKLPIFSEKRDFVILGHIWAWPLCVTFWISTFNLSYDIFPIVELIFPAWWPP